MSKWGYCAIYLVAVMYVGFGSLKLRSMKFKPIYYRILKTYIKIPKLAIFCRSLKR